MTEISRVILVVLDSVGVGELPDAHRYGDQGSNTLANCARAVGGINMPNMKLMGLGNIIGIDGVPPVESPAAAYGKMAEKSPGKDTTTGHWELAGIVLDRPFQVYPGGFPPELIREFEKRIKRKTIGNKAASGTEIIRELGVEHLRSGFPIVYTSADSVFQIAAHESVIHPEDLYNMCRIAREMMQGENAVGRVIARPFTGEPGSFVRTARRHDFSLPPPVPNLLTILKDGGYRVVAVGKVNDIFSGTGISVVQRAASNMECIDGILCQVKKESSGLIFANLVEFDMLYGHRNDPVGYAAALEAFDRRLPEITAAMSQADLLIITADHGCDPTTSSTDHSREYVPLLVYGKAVIPGTSLGTRETFADAAASIAGVFGLALSRGESFAPQCLKGG